MPTTAQWAEAVQLLQDARLYLEACGESCDCLDALLISGDIDRFVGKCKAEGIA